MTSRLNPFIYFGDTARQAMEFYRDVFGGHLAISTFAEFGQADSPDANKVMHAQLETSKGFTLMASDTPHGMEFKPGTNMSVRLRRSARLLGEAVRRRQRDRGDGEAGMGRRVRCLRRQVRHLLDDQHRPTAAVRSVRGRWTM